MNPRAMARAILEETRLLERVHDARLDLGKLQLECLAAHEHRDVETRFNLREARFDYRTDLAAHAIAHDGAFRHLRPHDDREAAMRRPVLPEFQPGGTIKNALAIGKERLDVLLMPKTVGRREHSRYFSRFTWTV